LCDTASFSCLRQLENIVPPLRQILLFSGFEAFFILAWSVPFPCVSEASRGSHVSISFCFCVTSLFREFSDQYRISSNGPVLADVFFFFGFDSTPPPIGATIRLRAWLFLSSRVLFRHRLPPFSFLFSSRRFREQLSGYSFPLFPSGSPIHLSDDAPEKLEPCFFFAGPPYLIRDNLVIKNTGFSSLLSPIVVGGSSPSSSNVVRPYPMWLVFSALMTSDRPITLCLSLHALLVSFTSKTYVC